MASPWLFVDRAALRSTVGAISTAAAKHGGNQVEVSSWRRALGNRWFVPLLSSA